MNIKASACKYPELFNSAESARLDINPKPMTKHKQVLIFQTVIDILSRFVFKMDSTKQRRVQKMMISEWRFEDQDYMGHVDCTCTNNDWYGGEIHESETETIFSHHDWNVCIVEEK